jgi:hypothetical protein
MPPLADLKTADEVRAHARAVQRRIDAAKVSAPPRIKPLPSLPVMAAKPKPGAEAVPLEDKVMRAFPIKAVLRTAATQSGLSFGRLRGEARDAVVCEARQVAFYVAHHLIGASFSAIGRSCHRDHSTIGHDYRIARERIDAGAEEFIARINAVGADAAALLRLRWAPVQVGPRAS